MACAKTLIMLAVAFSLALPSEGNLLLVQRFVTESNSTGSKDTCMSWCKWQASDWSAKCMWGSCKACSDCADACPLWCTCADRAVCSACEPCTASPTSSPTATPTASPTAAKTCSTIDHFTDLSGHPLSVGGKIRNSTAAECKSKCEETAECTCYAFDPSRSNTCWLKASPCGEEETWEESDDMTAGICQ